MLIINDIHAGCQRVAGTTPATQIALRDYVRDNLTQLLNMGEDEVTINGDLCDGFALDNAEVVKLYDIFSAWLDGGFWRRLNLVGGNHDFSAKGERLSSFHVLAHFLSGRHPGKVEVYDKGLTHIHGTVWAVPHQLNQDLFNVEIDKAAAMTVQGDILLLHCNYKNTFAEHSDNSLNLNDEQVGSLMRAGWVLVIGHEHVGYTLRGERVIVVGNQHPTSISDCIDDAVKHCLRVSADKADVIVDNAPVEVRVKNVKVELVETWNAHGNYVEIDWRDLAAGNATLNGEKFVRITGDATAEQAADVINVVARFRQNNENVLVAGNAVKGEGQAVLDDLSLDSIDAIKKFDVLGAIYEKLEPREIEVVKGLLS